MPVIRRGEPNDLAQIAAIQKASPEVPFWPADDYLKYELLVAVETAIETEDRVAGFLAFRSLFPGIGPDIAPGIAPVLEAEREILNLAVSPEFRRQGIAQRLWRASLQGFSGTVFLEVRESNQAAIALYLSLGFQRLSCRQKYYQDPPETAIVMKFHSC